MAIIRSREYYKCHVFNDQDAISTYIRTLNVIIDDWLPLLSKVELKILLFICRKTLGVNKTSEFLSLSKIQEGTGCSTDNICDSIKSLIKKELIYKEMSGENGDQKSCFKIKIKNITSNSLNKETV